MPNTSFGRVRLIPVWTIMSGTAEIPTTPGVYLFLAKGGKELLVATNYFELSRGRPRSIRKHVLLYCGAARSLRDRIKQHLYSDVTCSSLRRSLLAIQLQLGAISATKTPQNNVEGEKSLTSWMWANGLFAVIESDKPFHLEREILASHASPLNIFFRSDDRYARFLSALRCAAFPEGMPSRHRRLRKL